MSTNNLVFLRGRISSEPKPRTLPSGSAIVNLEVTTRIEGDQAASVPVMVAAETVDVNAGDEVFVLGHVRRRYFRVGGVTQSRTEVFADRVLPITRRKAIERLIAASVGAF
jgi:single-strand DNA-binding protein